MSMTHGKSDMFDLKGFWEKQHLDQEVRYLSNYEGQVVWDYLMVEPYLVPNANVLNIGVGTGKCTKDLNERGVNVYAVDICEKALETVRPYVKGSWLVEDYDKMPADLFDLAICHLVIQHMSDEAVLKQLKGVLRSLKKTGLFALQYASPHPEDENGFIYIESDEYQRAGAIMRKKGHMKDLIERSGGEIVTEGETKVYDNEYARCSWNSFIIRRRLTR